MQGLLLSEVKADLTMIDRDDPRPGAGEVVVQLRAAALNRRDFWITRGMYPGIQMPIILGSDGAGVVTQVGTKVDDQWNGRQVVVDPGMGWGENPDVQADDFQILGMPHDGTFATHVVVPAANLYPKPEHLSWTEAAALPLAGVTAFRAVSTKGQVRAGQRVLVTGIGGGVGTFALAFARAFGATVAVTSSSQEKLESAVSLGAATGFDYTDDDWAARAMREFGPPDVIIDAAGGQGYGKLLDLAAPGGRIVNYGATAGPPERLDLFKVFWKQLQICGSTMGAPSDFKAMLELINRESLRPVVDQVLPLRDGNQAISRMKDSRQFGKIVLDIPGSAS